MSKKKIKILNIVGARPNFMKIAPLYNIYNKNINIIEPILVHTRQHSDKKMSGIFFQTLGLPEPDYNLSTDTSSPILLISKIMSQLDEILEKEKPDVVLVVGDVNSTLAAALVANKKGIKVAHVESGLRSGDKTMPEEVNRILVDNISEYLFVTEKSGVSNLKNENIESSKIFFTGNVMIDNLITTIPKIDRSDINEKLNLVNKKYSVMTMHRPKNVDDEKGLYSILNIIENIIKEDIYVVFPIHPRTLDNLKKYPDILDKLNKIKKLIVTEPMGYIEFMKLIKDSAFVLTDSGGIQEEAAYLKIPTVTLRDSTERPSTVDCGSNHICPPNNEKLIMDTIKKILKMEKNDIKDVPLNDGKASQRIVKILLKNIWKKK